MNINNIADVVFHALSGKYGIADDDLLDGVILPIICGETPSIEVSSQIVGDVKSQVETLTQLQLEWSPNRKPNLTLEAIHRSFFRDRLDGARVRETEHVDDYEGTPPTALADIPARRMLIDAMLVRVDEMATEECEARCAFLAELFALIIGSHVYFDGNGRVARTAVQYALVRWRTPLIAIPKVRNAPRWKAALRQAVEGDAATLALYFSKLLSGESIHNIEAVSGGGGADA